MRFVLDRTEYFLLEILKQEVLKVNQQAAYSDAYRIGTDYAARKGAYSAGNSG